MKEKIEALIKEHSNIHIECSQDVISYIEDSVKEYDNYSIFDDSDGYYENMKVKDYLNFFAELLGNQNKYNEAIEYMHLSDFLHIILSKCNSQQLKRVLIAKEIIKDCDIYYFKEPLSGIDDESRKMILNWFDSLSKHHKKLITSSRSLKEVCLCDGYHVSIYNQNIKIIEQESSNETIDDSNLKIQKISVKANERIFLFNPEEIDYIEANEGKTNVVVRNEIYYSPLSMDELENKLHRFGFYRSHRSYLINMQKVTQIIKWTRNSYSLKLLNYEQVAIPLSKTKVQELKELYQF